MGTQTEQHAALFNQYRATGSEAVRNRIAEAYLPLVKDVAERMIKKLPAEVDLDDLIQAGSLGLLDAIRQFEPTRGFKFCTFAQHRVWGSIIDWLRQVDWVPRLVRERARRLSEAVGSLETELGRPPNQDELRQRLNVGDQRFALIFRAPPATMHLRLSEPVHDDEDGAAAVVADLITDHRERQPGEDVANRDAFDRIIKLVLREYTVTDALLLRLFYREGENLSTVAKHLGGLTESAMCIRRATLFKRLRSRRDLAELRDAVRGAA